MKNFLQRKKTLIMALLLFPALLIGVVFTADYKNVSAVPGNPGTLEAPEIIYSEDFQNTGSFAPTALTSYTGNTGMTYTANAAWLTNCNGEVLGFNTPDNAFSSSNCSVGDGGSFSGTNLTKAFDQVRRMAYALGQLNNLTTPANNKALTAYTDYGNAYANPGANKTQFETIGTVSLPSGSRRFVISNIDSAAVNCGINGTAEGKLIFYLLDQGIPRQINTTPINVCTNSAAQNYTPPTLNTNGALGPSNDVVKAGKIFTDKALLSNTNVLGIRMVNQEGSGQGNDNALDNIQLADASPKLDKSFSPDSVMVNETSKMTFVVTNTTDLLAKEGWSFTDNLPTNLQVAENPNVESDCLNASIVAQPRGTSVQYSGDLDQGMATCSLSVDVTSSEAGVYVNGPANLIDVVGLDLPADAQVTFAPEAPDTGDKATYLSTMYVAIGIGVAGMSLAIRRKFHIKK